MKKKKKQFVDRIPAERMRLPIVDSLNTATPPASSEANRKKRASESERRTLRLNEITINFHRSICFVLFHLRISNRNERQKEREQKCGRANDENNDNDDNHSEMCCLRLFFFFFFLIRLKSCATRWTTMDNMNTYRTDWITAYNSHKPILSNVSIVSLLEQAIKCNSLSFRFQFRHIPHERVCVCVCVCLQSNIKANEACILSFIRQAEQLMSMRNGIWYIEYTTKHKHKNIL